MAYILDYSPDAVDHLHQLTARQQSTILDVVERQLKYEPGLETRSHKPMRPNDWAPWELRIGDIRVYYDIVEEPEAVVKIRAIGIKRRNRVWIGGEEVHL